MINNELGKQAKSLTKAMRRKSKKLLSTRLKGYCVEDTENLLGLLDIVEENIIKPNRKEDSATDLHALLPVVPNKDVRINNVNFLFDKASVKWFGLGVVILIVSIIVSALSSNCTALVCALFTVFFIHEDMYDGFVFLFGVPAQYRWSLRMRLRGAYQLLGTCIKCLSHHELIADEEYREEVASKALTLYDETVVLLLRAVGLLPEIHKEKNKL